jgi:hypothetical protein
MVSDEELLQGFSRCRELGALPMVSRRYGYWHIKGTAAILPDVAIHPHTKGTAVYVQHCAGVLLSTLMNGALLGAVDVSWRCRRCLGVALLLLLGMCAQVHAENGEGVALGQQAVFEAGVTGPEGHPLSRPAVLEGEATARAIKLASFVGVPLYVVHVMSKDALEEVRRYSLLVQRHNALNTIHAG